MGLIAVILDVSLTARDAVYLSYQVAARSGAALVGVGSLGWRSLEDSEKLRHEFVVGARAAGVRAETVLLPSFSIKSLRERFTELEMLIIGLDTLVEISADKRLLAESPWPVWIVPQQLNLRRGLVVLEDPPENSPALAAGLRLGHRWRLELSVQVIGSRYPGLAELPSLKELSLPILAADRFDSRALDLLLREHKFDIVMLDGKILSSNNWDLSCCVSCVAAVYPLSEKIEGHRQARPDIER